MSKAPPEWKSDAERFYARQKFDKIKADLTADLPVNSVISIAIVDDPLSSTGQKIPVVRALRHDVLAQMRSRQQLDEAHFAAGRLWEYYFEQSEIGSIRAIDPSKEAVDGGRIPEMISDSQIKAFRKLNEGDCVLGEVKSDLVRDILGDRQTLRIAATNRGLTTMRGFKSLTDHFIESLNILAVLWGFSTCQ